MLKITKSDSYTFVDLDGKRQPIPDFRGRAEAMDSKPAADHAISRMGSVIGLDSLDVRLNNIISRDSAWTRERRAPRYDALCEALLPLGKPWGEAKKILGNRDLRPEIVHQRAREVLTKAIPALTPSLEKIVAETAQEARVVDQIRREVWTPDPADKDAYLKAREVRDVLRGMSEPERARLLMDAAKLGRLEVLGALKSDPFGLLVARLPEGTMDHAETLALSAAGLGWLDDWREDAHENLDHVVALASVCRAAILAAVPGEPMKLPHDVKPLQTIAAEALAA
ncbi:MAG TPA: hypothetical protein PKB11_05510 [Desulfovibrio sp.]|uniref:hypothetical protein n=1 Tax=Desulfovibrio sp. TaxID=885 RepID=UPI002CCAB850|nr:hypothetical protein [Desulfovibrio sp.]HMM38196.1 hypothetical protein [Desulfovibrio sp.]